MTQVSRYLHLQVFYDTNKIMRLSSTKRCLKLPVLFILFLLIFYVEAFTDKSKGERIHSSSFRFESDHLKSNPDLQDWSSDRIIGNELKNNFIYATQKVQAQQVTPLNHTESELHAVEMIAKEILNEIQEKSITLIGEATMISNCPHNCNNQGLCQRIFVKAKVSDSPESFEYEPRFSCACRENFKGAFCNECAKGFYGNTCYPCPRNPVDRIICGIEGICDDGVDGTGKCACLDSNSEGAFCNGIGQHQHHNEEEVFTFGFIILVLIALSCTLLLYLYHKYKALQSFPESVTAIIFGTIVGLIIKYYYHSNYLTKILSFEPHTFFLFLLPPIMYEAGFSLKANIFFRNFLTISAYAILATAIASFVFTLIFYYMSTLTEYPFYFIDSFQFGCLISAIDPVATISIFKSLRVSEKLFMIVFGESAINDAVSIALARSAENVAYMTENQENIMLEASIGTLTHFLIYFFGSMLVGAICGIIVSYIFAKIDFYVVPWIETGLFFILSYLPYILSESLGLSGILAILISAIFMRNYAFHSLSPVGQLTVENIVGMTCQISENFVFAYMGLSVPLTLGLMRIELIGIGVLALVVSRTLSVVATTLLVNIFREDRIAMSYQIIMSFSGLRGAVAFYLALNVSSEFKNLIVTTTIGLIIITIVCFGGTTTCLLKAMAKYFPEDGIFYNEEEELLLRGERGYSDMSESFYDKNFQEDRPRGVSQDKSIGVITRLERIDMDYGRRYLRKEGYVEGWNDFFDNDSQYGGDAQDVKNSVRNKSRLYDDLSNYQASVRHYMECSAANLPYEDRKSVRLSMVSERRNAKPDQSKFLHVNRRRQGVVCEDYSNNLNLSRRGQSLHQAMRQEQMSIMSEPRGFNPGLRGFDAYLHDKNSRLNVPPTVIQIAKLDDISSKGSNGDSKHARNRSKDVVGQPDNRDNKDSGKAADPKPAGSQLPDSTTNLTTDKAKSRPRVTFQEPDKQVTEPRSEVREESKEELKDAEQLKSSERNNEENQN